MCQASLPGKIFVNHRGTGGLPIFLSFVRKHIFNTNNINTNNRFPSLAIHDFRQKGHCWKGKAGYFSLGYRKGVEEVKQTEKGLRSQRTRNLNSKQLQQPSVAEGRKKKVLRNKGGLCRRKEHLASVRLTFLHRCWDVYSLLCRLWENISSLSPVILLWSFSSLSICQNIIANFFSLMSRLWWIHCAPLTHTPIPTHIHKQAHPHTHTHMHMHVHAVT